MVEHAIENRSVGGSIPPLGTTSNSPLKFPDLNASGLPLSAHAVHFWCNADTEQNSVFTIDERQRGHGATIDLQVKYVRAAIMARHIQRLA